MDVNHGEYVEQPGGHQKFGAVVGEMRSPIGRPVAKPGGNEVKSAHRHVAHKTGELNQAGRARPRQKSAQT